MITSYKKSRRAEKSRSSLPCAINYRLYNPAIKLLILFCGGLFLHSLNLNGQSEKVDESRGIVLVVNLVLVEGGDILVIEGIGGLHAGVDDVALVELQADVARHGFLCSVNECRERLSQRRVPLSVVDQNGKSTRKSLLFVGHHLV